MKNKGFSLIELMVGLFVSMLVVLAVAGSAKFLEAQKRISMGTNNVLENLSLSSRVISSSVRMSGYGLSLCPTTNLVFSRTAAGVTTNRNESYTTPFTITEGGSPSVSDSFTTLYGDSTTGTSTSFVTSMTGNNFTTGYAGHVNVQGLVLISDATLCTVYGVSEIQHTSATEDKVLLDTTIAGVHWNATKNDYPVGSVVIGLSSVKNLTYSIVNNSLQETDSITNLTAVVADNIVLMKVYYGLTDGTFVAASTNPSVDYIRSARVFIVARSAVLNKKDTAGNCTATTNPPATLGVIDGSVTPAVVRAWTGGPIISLTAITDWGCYRYKTVDFIIPLKNKFLGGS